MFGDTLDFKGGERRKSEEDFLPQVNPEKQWFSFCLK